MSLKEAVLKRQSLLFIVEGLYFPNSKPKDNGHSRNHDSGNHSVETNRFDVFSGIWNRLDK